MIFSTFEPLSRCDFEYILKIFNVCLPIEMIFKGTFPIFHNNYRPTFAIKYQLSLSA